MAQRIQAMTEDQPLGNDQTMTIVEAHRVPNRLKSLCLPEEVTATEKEYTGRRRMLRH